MHFDFSSVDDVESYISVPEGVHNCRIAEVREGRSRDGSVRWSFRLEVLDGDYAGRTAAWDSFTWSERGVYRVKKVLDALGLDVRGELEIDPADLVNLQARVKVEPEEREDPVTGRRQVRMRVPYLGYAALEEDVAHDTDERASLNGKSSESEEDAEARSRKTGEREANASSSKRDSIAPVDDWRGRRDASAHDDEDAEEGFTF
jgi:Protein of unknown function (DUF669)